MKSRKAMNRFRKRSPRRAKQLTQAESLESREMFSVDGISASFDTSHSVQQVEPAWFASIDSSQPTGFENNGKLTLWRGREVEAVPQQWIVKLSGVGSVQEASEYLSGVDSQFEVVQGLGQQGFVLVRSGELGKSQIERKLGDAAKVHSFEPNSIVRANLTANDPLLNAQWGLNNVGQDGGMLDADIDAPEAWNIATGNSEVVIGVIDTGIDLTHPDLANNLWVNPGEIPGDGIDNDQNGFVDDVHGYDFHSNDSNPLDIDGHGTHVAGTIAADSNNGLGVAGVSWDASLMAIRVLGSDGVNQLANAIRGINYASMMKSSFDTNIVATNNSWGANGSSPALYESIRFRATTISCSLPLRATTTSISTLSDGIRRLSILTTSSPWRH